MSACDPRLYNWQVFERVERVSSGLIALGHKPRENLGIFAETQAGWIVTLQAATRQSIPVVTGKDTNARGNHPYAFWEWAISVDVAAL